VVFQEDAKTSWSNVESSYQRRADLIPNLVSTVKGYAAHEKETLEAVISARASATSTTIDANNLTAEKMAQFQRAQQGLAGALGKLMVVAERYPDLKANQNFIELQSQLEGTENRINVERNRFNGFVNNYNKFVKIFPNSIFAGWFGFEEMNRFQSSEGSEKAPAVTF
jgi:LemA protein